MIWTFIFIFIFIGQHRVCVRLKLIIIIRLFIDSLNCTLLKMHYGWESVAMRDCRQWNKKVTPCAKVFLFNYFWLLNIQELVNFKIYAMAFSTVRQYGQCSKIDIRCGDSYSQQFHSIDDLKAWRHHHWSFKWFSFAYMQTILTYIFSIYFWDNE